VHNRGLFAAATSAPETAVSRKLKNTNVLIGANDKHLLQSVAAAHSSGIHPGIGQWPFLAGNTGRLNSVRT
jgi:hypothetical protein